MKCNYSVKQKWTNKYNGKKYTYKDTHKTSTTITNMYGAPSLNSVVCSRSTTYDYKFAKLSNFKAKKAKGFIIFIEPNNIIGKEEVKESDGKLSRYRIKLKYPYDENTRKETKYNEETGQYDILYYYCYCTKDGFIW